MRFQDAILWQVYPLGFCGAPIREAATPAPRLRRLLNWLDHAVELGTSGLLLGPVFASSTHGYDSLDQFAVDPRLGTEQDLADLVEACHDRGLVVVLDGVFNHVGRDHPRFRQALLDGPDGPDADLFAVDWAAEGGPHAAVFEGHDALVALNHSSAAAREYVRSVMEYWLERGIDGWRLDAAYTVDPTFWAAVLPAVRERHPDAWFVGEVIHGDYADFVRRSGVDTVTQYELWSSVGNAIASRNFFELDWTLQRHNAFLADFVPATFIGNHDVTRIASTVGEDRAVLALAVLMTVGGIPTVYAGDEFGYTGVKEEREGGDDAVRPEFPDTPGDVAPWGASVLQAHRQLIALRRRYRWLVTATTTAEELTNTRYRYRVRAAGGSDELLVELDIGDRPSGRILAGDRVEWSTAG
ncbi:glycosidase [Nakamurella flavida]|uniref:alpha-amylase family protein n=1 Tax=Nakamurella flavida TaxID=363630 RepID=UPI002789F339|nr:alpha-amylase family protein [Nakamurella flavida]MDP9777568.1 glycosidase [Nakamurella flavida]